jgi:hypothetical protein
MDFGISLSDERTDFYYTVIIFITIMLITHMSWIRPSVFLAYFP